MSMNKGFTLIETIIYLALFGILMTGVVVTAYNLFEAQSRAHTIAVVQEEGDYLLGKALWVLYGARAVTVPAAGATGSNLTVTKWSGSFGNPLNLCLVGTDLRFATGTSLCATDGKVLNNADVQISSLMFTHLTTSGEGINPTSVRVSFTVASRLTNGMLVTRPFSGISYLRQ